MVSRVFLFTPIHKARLLVRSIHTGPGSLLDAPWDISSAEAKQAFAYAKAQEEKVEHIRSTFRAGGGPVVRNVWNKSAIKEIEIEGEN